MKQKFIAFGIGFLVISGSMFAQQKGKMIEKQKFNLNKAGEDEIGYAQAVKVGNTIYVSGSVGWGKMDSALHIAYKQIEQTLKHYDATFANVVKENLHTTMLDSMIAHKDVRRVYYGTDYPAATWDEVKRLYNADLVVEIEVIAVLPEVGKK